MRTRILLLMSMMMLITAPLYAQRKIKKMDDEKPQKDEDAKNYGEQPWTEKIKYGSGLWAFFGSDYSIFYIQPWVGYEVNERFLPGAGITYIYQSQTLQYYGAPPFTVSDNVFGLNFFAKERIVGPITLYGEYAPIKFTSFNLYGDTKKIWDQQLYIGGGLFQGHSYLIVMYDLLWQQWNQTYATTFNPNFKPSPVDIKVGFYF